MRAAPRGVRLAWPGGRMTLRRTHPAICEQVILPRRSNPTASLQTKYPSRKFASTNPTSRCAKNKNSPREGLEVPGQNEEGNSGWIWLQTPRRTGTEHRCFVPSQPQGCARFCRSRAICPTALACPNRHSVQCKRIAASEAWFRSGSATVSPAFVQA